MTLPGLYRFLILKGVLMIKRRIKYTDYNDVEREEDFWFNLSEAETLEMEMSKDGGVTGFIQRIVEAKNAPEIIAFWKDFILKCYGEKSADGRRFIKSKELSDAFSQTEAYSNLFMELSTDADLAAAFINGVVPKPKEAKKP